METLADGNTEVNAISCQSGVCQPKSVRNQEKLEEEAELTEKEAAAAEEEAGASAYYGPTTT